MVTLAADPELSLSFDPRRRLTRTVNVVEVERVCFVRCDSVVPCRQMTKILGGGAGRQLEHALPVQCHAED